MAVDQWIKARVELELISRRLSALSQQKNSKQFVAEWYEPPRPAQPVLDHERC
jgi:hypothetical protein